MSKTAREWPNNAKDARDRAAEEAQGIVIALSPLLDEAPITETDRVRRTAKAINAAQRICRILEAVGAQTRA